MSSTSVLPPGQMKQPQQQQRVKLSGAKKKNKHDRIARKRCKSFSGCGLVEPKPVLPTKFLLGGNINDPLNLNSLQDEEVNRAMNAVTPRSSPIPTPPRRKGIVEVILPPNAPDPLRLTDCADDDEYEQQVCGSSPVKQRRRRKKRRTVSASDCCSDAEVSLEVPVDSGAVVAEPKKTEQSEARPKDLAVDPGGGASGGSARRDRKRKSEEGPPAGAPKKFKNPMDKIVSPVVPQPGAWLKRSNLTQMRGPRERRRPEGAAPPPVFKDEHKKFQYGNYNRYYGYRNPNSETDHRLRLFAHHASLFRNRDVLDVGCNVGHVTLSVARDLGARSVLGVDIDPALVSAARKNVRHYVSSAAAAAATTGPQPGGARCRAAPPRGRGFPHNVTFKQCNYVPEDEAALALEQPQFDVVMCLSVTKWMHLNWGDAGLKLAFRRMYEQLRPGGKLVLEPQNWASYKSKKKLTETIWKNYNQIEFTPDKFSEYLLSPAVGFAKCEILGKPAHRSAGFRRPVQVFTKSTMFPSDRVETPHPGFSDSVYQRLLHTEKYEAQPADLVEHVYTDLLDDRYCLGTEEASVANRMIGENLEGEEGEGARGARAGGGDNT